jgi:predicted ribosomally synthesized peptide with nif11-like leader
MSKESFQNFLDRVAKDDALRRELAGMATGTPGAMPVEVLARFAAERGFAVTADDVRSHSSELSDSELEGVAGGFGGGMITPSRALGQKDWVTFSPLGVRGSQ